MTFSGLAKPHCNVCSSPYHIQDDCPSADPNRKPRRTQTVCFDFSSTSPPVVTAATATTHTCTAAVIPVAMLPRLAKSRHPLAPVPSSPRHSVSAAKSKVAQLRRHVTPQVSSPIDIYRLELELANHPDKTFVFNLLSMLREGAHIGYSGPRTRRVFPNLISAAQLPDVVTSNLHKEVTLGRVAGPYPSPRPHLSYPQGTSINDHIPKDPFSLSYVRVDDAISILQSLGRGAFMAKTDLKSAFRLIPIHSND